MVDRFPYAYGNYGSETYGFIPYVYVEAVSSFALGGNLANAVRTLQGTHKGYVGFASTAMIENANERSAFASVPFGVSSVLNSTVTHQADPNSQSLKAGHEALNYTGPYWVRVQVEQIEWPTLPQRTLVL